MTITEGSIDELRELNDPWVDWFLREQERISGDMKTSELCHMAESFGRPGSLTHHGRKYREQSFELTTTQLRLTMYCMAKGYVSVDQINVPEGDPPS